jgi:hypothetical protein
MSETAELAAFAERIRQRMLVCDTSQGVIAGLDHCIAKELEAASVIERDSSSEAPNFRLSETAPSNYAEWPASVSTPAPECDSSSSEAGMPSDDLLTKVERYIITNTQRCWESDYKPSLKEAFAAVLASTPAPKRDSEAVKALTESTAKSIYEAMCIAVDNVAPNYHPPKWVEGGNSLMQEQARRTAAALTASPAPEPRETPEHPLEWDFNSSPAPEALKKSISRRLSGTSNHGSSVEFTFDTPQERNAFVAELDAALNKEP